MEGRSCGGGVTKGSGIKVLVSDSDMSEPQKLCPQCRKYRSYREFNYNRTRFDGFSSECKKCVNANQAGYRAKRLASKGSPLASSD
jgi:hypothetical protein